MKEIGVVSWKLPPREMSCQCFREIFPQRKYHVYSKSNQMHDNSYNISVTMKMKP